MRQAPSLPSTPVPTSQVDSVRRWIDQTRELARNIDKDLVVSETGLVQELQARLASSEEDRQTLMQQVVEMDRRLGRLVSLYVATYQLHSSLNLGEVHSALADIALNIVGAEQFALLVRRNGTRECDVVLTQGLDEIESAIFPAEGYSGGDPLVDATLEDGLLRTEPLEGSCATAAVPLLILNSVVGVLVIIKLFDHRERLGADDRELFDLLACHAGSALFSAQVFSQLRSLESIMQLTRKKP